MKLACIMANDDENDPDPDCNMTKEEIQSARYGSHAARRASDTEARRYAAKHNIDKSRINMRMGWKEAELALDSQTHYEESHLQLRWESAMLSSEF